MPLNNKYQNKNFKMRQSNKKLFCNNFLTNNEQYTFMLCNLNKYFN